jgi:hypothetical protein
MIVSPLSRGRKPRKKAGRKKRSFDDERREAFELVIGNLSEMSTSDETLEAELLVSAFLGGWWLPGRPDEANREFGLSVIDLASGRPTPAALGLLRALQALGPSAELRERAGVAADGLADGGAAEPPWAGGLRRVTVSECWQETDVYGDGASLLLICDRAGRRHGLVVEVDHNGGGVVDAFLTAEPDEVLREMSEAADDNELVVTERLTLPGARRIIEDAIAVNDGVLTMFSQPEPDDPLTEPRAYVLARLRAMPTADPRGEPGTFGADERDALVRRFFAESGTTDDSDTRLLARAIVDFGCDSDGGRPTRVGPEKLAVLVEELEDSQELDEAALETLPEVLPRWAKWAGERSGLTEHAVEELVALADEIAADVVDWLAEDWEGDEEDFAGEAVEEGENGIPVALRRR